jgi:hypothetical protein
MAEYSRLAKGSFTAATGQTSAVVTLPFTPDYVEVWNLTNIGSAALAGNILRAYWDNNIPPYTPSGKSASQTMVEVYNATPAVIYDTVYTNGVTGGTAPAAGISAFSGGIALQYGATQQISGITKANPAVVTTVSAHGYNVGDTVIMQGIALSTTNNMQLLNGVPFTITAVGSSTTFTIKWDSSGSNYTAISGSPAGALVKKVLYPFLYLPEDNVVSFVTLGNTTTVATTMYHNFEVGQEIAFRIPPLWGVTQLNSLPNVLIPGQPIYGYVSSVTDNWTFVCTINSTAFTAYTNNFTMTAATLSGLTYPQTLSVGDVNTGGQIYGLNGTTILYPPPFYPTSTNRVPSINGPAIRGAFTNNTSQGFIIGNGTPQEQAGTGTIVTSGAEVLWHAYLHDFASP